MTLVDLSEFITWPACDWEPDSNPRTQANGPQLNADADQVAWIYQIERSETATHIGFVVAAFTTTGNVKVELQTVSLTTGLPTGTAYDTANISAAVSVSGNGYIEIALGNNVSLTAGEWVAAVITAEPTPNIPDFEIQNQDRGRSLSSSTNYRASDIVGSGWIKVANPVAWLIAVRTSTGYVNETQFPGIVTSIGSVLFNNTDTKKEYGISLTVPFKCTAIGLWALVDVNDVDYILRLYETGADPEGATLLTKTIDGNLQEGTGKGPKFAYFASGVDLVIDTVYRMVARAGTASDISVPNFVFNSSDLRKASWAPDNVFRTEPVDATPSNGWTDSTDEYIPMGLILSRLDDGAGGGGGLAFINRSNSLLTR